MFANTAFHKRAILLTFYTEYAESVLDFLSYPEPTIGPPWLGPEKNILRRLEDAIFRLVFANIVNSSFNFMFFQLLYKFAQPSNIQKLPDLDNAMNKFYLNFL